MKANTFLNFRPLLPMTRKLKKEVIVHIAYFCLLRMYLKIYLLNKYVFSSSLVVKISLLYLIFKVYDRISYKIRLHTLVKYIICRNNLINKKPSFSNFLNNGIIAAFTFYETKQPVSDVVKHVCAYNEHKVYFSFRLKGIDFELCFSKL